MCEILLLGSFHFNQTALDIFDEKSQRQLARLNEKLATFAPDAICVEADIKSQSTVDELYQRLDPAGFSDADTMRSSSLGEIEAYGQTVRATYDNEIIQIGFRLAKQLGHERVCAIDDELPLADEALGKAIGPYKERWEQGLSHINDWCAEEERAKCLIAYLQFLNYSEWTERNHRWLYVRACKVGHYPDYAGAQMTASWYERNLRIFSNLCAVAAENKRVLVVYGAGHLKLLREWIEACDDFELCPATAYLEDL